MKLIVTMAGEYTRFADFSSEIPKYLLPIKKGLVLDAVLKPYASSRLFKQISLICNEKDKRFHKLVEERLNFFSNSLTELIYIKTSSSQVDTALQAVQLYESNNNMPVLIANIDTILLRRDFMKINNYLKDSDGIIDTFRAYDKAYSYVMTNDNNEVINIKEKIQISDTASSGLYGFNSSNEFLKITKRLINKVINFSELYQIMISEGRNIKAIHNELSNNTKVVGTPSQYLDYIASE